jgi:hypothetical protein
MNEGRPGEVVELLGICRDHLRIERLEQQQMLLERGGDSAAAKRFDKADEHENRLSPAAKGTPWRGG